MMMVERLAEDANSKWTLRDTEYATQLFCDNLRSQEDNLIREMLVSSASSVSLDSAGLVLISHSSGAPFFGYQKREWDFVTYQPSSSASDFFFTDYCSDDEIPITPLSERDSVQLIALKTALEIVNQNAFKGMSAKNHNEALSAKTKIQRQIFELEFKGVQSIPRPMDTYSAMDKIKLGYR